MSTSLMLLRSRRFSSLDIHSLYYFFSGFKRVIVDSEFSNHRIMPGELLRAMAISDPVQKLLLPKADLSLFLIVCTS